MIAVKWSSIGEEGGWDRSSARDGRRRASIERVEVKSDGLLEVAAVGKGYEPEGPFLPLIAGVARAGVA